MIQPGETIWTSDGSKLRVVDVVPVEEEELTRSEGHICARVRPRNLHPLCTVCPACAVVLRQTTEHEVIST